VVEARTVVPAVMEEATQEVMVLRVELIVVVPVLVRALAVLIALLVVLDVEEEEEELEVVFRMSVMGKEPTCKRRPTSMWGVEETLTWPDLGRISHASSPHVVCFLSFFCFCGGCCQACLPLPCHLIAAKGLQIGSCYGLTNSSSIVA